MTIKTVTLKNGKEYRVTVRKHSIDVSVKTCRVHHEVSLPTYMTVTGKHVVANVMAALVEADHAEALEIDAILNEHNKEMDQLGFLLNAPAQRRKMIERDHEEALAMDAELSSQDQARKQTVARRNSLSHKIGLAFAGAALLFSGMTRAEVVPSYPVDASRMSLEGSVAVSIDCDAKKVDVLRESTTAAYFSKQVKKQVWNICYGQSGTLDRVYTFVMNKQVGAHDMAVNNSDRHPL